MRVMDDEVGFADSVAELNDFDVAVGFAADAFVAIFTEDKRLAVFKLDDVLAASIAFREREPGTIVEDVAILKDFHEGRALVRGRVLQGFFQMALEDVEPRKQHGRLAA